MADSDGITTTQQSPCRRRVWDIPRSRMRREGSCRRLAAGCHAANQSPGIEVIRSSGNTRQLIVVVEPGHGNIRRRACDELVEVSKVVSSNLRTRSKQLRFNNHNHCNTKRQNHLPRPTARKCTERTPSVRGSCNSPGCHWAARTGRRTKHSTSPSRPASGPS